MDQRACVGHGLEVINWRAEQAISPMAVNRKVGEKIERPKEPTRKASWSAFYKRAGHNFAPCPLYFRS